MGGTASFSASLAGVMPGDTLCFQLRADDELGDLNSLNCCLTEQTYCMVVPTCCAPPEIVVNGETSICNGGSTQLCVKQCCENATYHWDNGSTDPCITVSSPGTYFVKVLCDSIQYTLSTTIDSLDGPSVSLPDAEFCQSSGSVLLNGSPAGGTYSGSSAVSAEGYFDLSEMNIGSHNVMYTYTDSISGCIGFDEATITVNKNPPCRIASEGWVGDRPNTIYTGYGPSCIKLIANVGAGLSYSWSTGETTQSPLKYVRQSLLSTGL